MSDPQNTLVVLFVAVFFGALITYVLSRHFPQAPYTVLVFFAGIVISGIFGNTDRDDSLKQSLDIWQYISPEIILYTFLPALLFGEAMSLNFHHIKGAIGNASLLAAPGALFGTFATAGLAKWCFPYDWSWHLCFLFGSILCATDPVAVVALLKKAGASHKLTYVIIGEALLNDGTALVLYNLLYVTIAVDPDVTLSPANIFLYFLKVIVLSPLLGALFGAVAVYLMSVTTRRMKEEDTTVQMAITLVCAYVSFYVAEYQCGISGVICCCTAGVVLARFANPLVLKPETLRSIWAAFEWLGNTIIFFLAGIILTMRSFDYIEAQDVGVLILTFLGVFVIRAVMVAMFFPVMHHVGEGVTAPEGAFIAWAGLRGAVSIALALSLVESTENEDTTISKNDSHRVLFLVGGLAAMTLSINATTTSILLRRLGLLTEASADAATNVMYRYARKTIRLKAFKLLEQVTLEHPDQVDPDFVIASCSIMRDIEDDRDVSISSATSPLVRAPSELDKATELSPKGGPDVVNKPDAAQQVYARATTTPGGEHEANYSDALTGTIASIVNTRARGRSLHRDNRRQYTQAQAQAQAQGDADGNTAHLQKMLSRTEAPQHRSLAPASHGGTVVADIRRAFLNVVRVCYWRQINSGRLPRRSGAALVLLNSIDVALENVGSIGLADWSFMLTAKKRLFDDVMHAHEQFKPRAAAAVGTGTGAGTTMGNPLLSSPQRRASAHDTGYETEPASAYTLLDDAHSATPSRWDTASVSTSGRESIWLSQRIDDAEQYLRDYRCAQAVYLLASFIEAHEHAQKTIPFFLGKVDQQHEELVVIRESQDAVGQAVSMLQHIHPSIVRRQLSKLAVRWILHMQEEAAEAFQTEGVITADQGELLLGEVERDMHSMKQIQWYAVVYMRGLHLVQALCSRGAKQ